MVKKIGCGSALDDDVLVFYEDIVGGGMMVMRERGSGEKRIN